MKYGNFFMVNNDVFRYKLSPIAFYVYCYLLRCNSRERGCYPSKRTIAEACGIAVSSVSKALTLLKACGLISVRHNFADGRQINNTYVFQGVDCLADSPLGHDESSPV
ncbi:helix-turn-helix domain-containing protein [Caproiciproducens sp. CPB-2]|uniref:helix-turn-helix domain-containing protein n=1 Tax=Caproiciproducens sp. CPB-2 TaxID=3030017 RepID=UPI0023DADD0E|nr:helix-turn-helix domain-containing protein [Caproiciproducens sp. CPB-2]MDF1494149.1 helix-turn-helix domain-containing protein [Caproiciproducens sp. CPB-2]